MHHGKAHSLLLKALISGCDMLHNIKVKSEFITGLGLMFTLLNFRLGQIFRGVSKKQELPMEREITLPSLVFFACTAVCLWTIDRDTNTDICWFSPVFTHLLSKV